MGIPGCQYHSSSRYKFCSFVKITCPAVLPILLQTIAELCRIPVCFKILIFGVMKTAACLSPSLGSLDAGDLFGEGFCKKKKKIYLFKEFDKFLIFNNSI